MSTCLDCGRSRFAIMPHACPPKWCVWSPELGEEIDTAKIVYADDAAQAAGLWAKRHDENGETPPIKGSAAEVLVQRLPDGYPMPYRVSGLIEISYRVKQL